MKNPFQYGGIVGEDAFCNRKKEIAELLQSIQNCEKVFVYSERRIGKTSLIKIILKRLPKKQFISVYVDLWPTDNEETFITTVAKAITTATSGAIESMVSVARSLFTRLTPTISVDEDGKPALTFGVNKSSITGQELDEVLSAPEKIATKGKKNVVIVFDEFQRIMDYRTDIVERKLRSIVQTHTNVSYIFMGSRKHVIQKMFLDKSRPLYRSSAHYPLKSIDEQEWIPFISERFERFRKRISKDMIAAICSATQGHPFYTQHLCNITWELCEPGNHVSATVIANAVDTVLERESYAYATLWETLTLNQRKFLKALASEIGDIKPFAADFLRRHRLGSISSVQRSVHALLDKDVIEPENGSFIIADRFFRLWLRKMEAA